MKEKETLQTVIALLVAVFLISSLIPFFTGSAKALIVLSGSMTPLMLPGDMITVKSVNPDELEVGDVIAFRDPGSKPDSFVTHRIISIEERDERVFRTKGDANEEEDSFKVPASNVVGRLTFVIPFAGYLPAASRDKTLFFFTVILPACLIILDEVRNIIKYSNPASTHKMKLDQKKTARRVSPVVLGKWLATLILISGFVFSGIVADNQGKNGPAVLEEENIIENSGFLPLVYVFMPDNPEHRVDIDHWYGVVPPADTIQVTAPENTPVVVSSAPYILPVFWIIALADVNPYLPGMAGVVLYTLVFALLLFPLWHRKSASGKRRKRVRPCRLFAQWKRALHIS
ncbi:signal peptidase I [Methanosarcina hadiensis]|uniref:signal peptidase I n=1 Tax=Methanosarcina hadiensis TaxID=3078083 RepID=UPI003977BAB9